MGSSSPSDFLERARAEAARYGSDPWIFVRELLQNGRDAGARTVVITTGRDASTEWVSCRDDGDGMSFDHARAYLFTLYASSKEGTKQAGQFGVGFWSVLRFEPARITVRSWPKKPRGPWEISLDGGLTRATRGAEPGAVAGMKSGTEVVLLRSGGDGHLGRRVFDAVWQSSRYLSRRDDASKPIALWVDGKRANAPFELPAPSASFRRGALRGVVGLGKEARVELFSKGLRVRSAPMLDDLLSASGRATAAARVAFPELEDGLAPQALLENPDLELLLSRSDVKGNKSLEKTVRTAHRELERLIERQLSSSRPPSFGRRVLEVLSAVPPAASLAIVAAAIATLVAVARPPALPHLDAGFSVSAARGGGGDSPPTPAAYRDLSTMYAGPQADTLGNIGAAVPLRYTPVEQPQHFTTLVVESLDGDGRPAIPVDPLEVYHTGRCDADCVTVELGVDAPAGQLRLPVPAGHRVDTGTVRFEGTAPPLLLGSAPTGEAVIVAGAPVRGVLLYATGPAPAPRAIRGTSAPEEMPPEMETFAGVLRRRPMKDRAAMAAGWVRRHVAYSVSPETAAKHRDAIARRKGFLERTLAIGEGDCDVQNGVLAALMQSAGLEARLVVGYLGSAGQAQPWLHAWVEWREPGTKPSPWRVIDASEGASPFGPGGPLAPIAARPPLTGAPAVAAPGADPGIAASGAPATPRRRWNLPDARTSAFGTSGLLLCFAVALTLGGRTRRSTRLDPRHDVSRLLRGALVQPDAFRHVPALFHRPIIPLAGGGTCSLAEAWILATRTRLFQSTKRSPLAIAADRAGAMVLDATTREGEAVAESLGAIDLDGWDVALRASKSHPLLERLSKHLAREGEDWKLRSAPVPATLDVLDLPTGRGSGRRWVLLDPEEPFFRSAVAMESTPDEALFRVADAILERLELPDASRRRLLARLAAAALAEGGAP